MDLRNKAADRLIRYAKIMTPSNAKSQTVPSSICQFDLAHVLVEELRQMGIDNAYADDKCYVYASIPGHRVHRPYGYGIRLYQNTGHPPGMGEL